MNRTKEKGTKKRRSLPFQGQTDAFRTKDVVCVYRSIWTSPIDRKESESGKTKQIWTKFIFDLHKVGWLVCFTDWNTHTHVPARKFCDVLCSAAFSTYTCVKMSVCYKQMATSLAMHSCVSILKKLFIFLANKFPYKIILRFFSSSFCLSKNWSIFGRLLSFLCELFRQESESISGVVGLILRIESRLTSIPFLSDVFFLSFFFSFRCTSFSTTSPIFPFIVKQFSF